MKHLPRRSFLTGLLALPAALLLPWQNESGWPKTKKRPIDLGKPYWAKEYTKAKFQQLREAKEEWVWYPLNKPIKWKEHEET